MVLRRNLRNSAGFGDNLSVTVGAERARDVVNGGEMRLDLQAGMLAGVVLCTAALTLRADEPAAVPEPIFTRQTAFSIPFQVDRAAAVQPVEVQLHVSPDRGGRWDLYDKVKPDRGSFIFRAPHDGEYWFCIRSTDKQGNPMPSAPYSAGLKVIVDTLGPRLDVTAERLPAGELSAQWQAVDPALQPDTLKLAYRTGDDAEWQELAAAQARITEGRSTLSGDGVWWPQNSPGAITLRVEVSDKAGNPTITQVKIRAPGDNTAREETEDGPSLSGDRTADAEPARAEAKQVSVSRRESRTIPTSTKANLDTNVEANPFSHYSDPPTEEPVTEAAAPNEPWPKPQNRTWPAQAESARPLGSAVNENGWRVADLPGKGNRPGFVHTGGGNNSGHTRMAEVSGGSLGQPSGKRFDFADLSPAEQPKMVNSRTFQIEYEVESVGSAGVAQVELFGTRDGGESWTSLGTDPDNRSPLVVTVNGEGLYGFQVVVQSASGLSGPPPRSGQRPELWIGVDLTKPEASLTGAEPGNNPDELTLSWQARDARLEARPVALYFSNRPGGPWTPIASGLENTGSYTWRMDNRVRQQVYIKLEVRDEARNIAICEPADPISLQRQLPQGRIRGVRPVAPPGNDQAGRPRMIYNDYVR
jgi:hypothetical protein